MHTRSTSWIMIAALITCALSLTATGCATPEQQKDEKLKELQDANFHYKLGAGYFQEHNVPMAIRELSKAIEMDPEHALAHYQLGYIYMGRRTYNKAIVHFKTALEIEPGFFDAKNALGATYLATERWRDAIDLFTELLEEPLYTSPELAHNNAGWAYYNLRKYGEAINHLKQAVFLKPEFCLAYNNLGMAQNATRNSSEAERSFRRAIELCPTNYAEPHFNLARMYQSRGDMRTARAHFERCSTLSPNNSLGDRCREYLNY